jgi:hypothetical protein
MCCTHHQLVHDGLLGIEGDAGGLTFRFGDGREVATTHVGLVGRARLRSGCGALPPGPG